MNGVIVVEIGVFCILKGGWMKVDLVGFGVLWFLLKGWCKEFVWCSDVVSVGGEVEFWIEVEIC